MRKQLMIFALCLPMLAVGCKTAATAPPLAPGYANSADQTMGEVLAAANGFYHSIQCQTKGQNWINGACASDPKVTGPMALSATEKQAFNSFALSINVANQVYLSYHAGTATQAAAQAAIDTVQNQQTALQNALPQAVK